MAFNGMFGQQNYFGNNNFQSPTPNGPVFLTNTASEAANIPCGYGTTVSICLNENMMFLKSNSNGNQNTLAYKLIPYKPEPTTQNSNNPLEERMNKVEGQLGKILEQLNRLSCPQPKEEKPKTESNGWDV